MYRLSCSCSIHLLPPPQQCHRRGLVSVLCRASPQTRSCWRPHGSKTTPYNLQQPSSRSSYSVTSFLHQRSCPSQPSSLPHHLLTVLSSLSRCYLSPGRQDATSDLASAADITPAFVHWVHDKGWAVQDHPEGPGHLWLVSHGH